MKKPHKTFHVVGERRPDLDIERFADALIAFALHRLNATAATTDQASEPANTPDAEPEREAS